MAHDMTEWEVDSSTDLLSRAHHNQKGYVDVERSRPSNNRIGRLQTGFRGSKIRARPAPRDDSGQNSLNFCVDNCWEGAHG